MHRRRMFVSATSVVAIATALLSPVAWAGENDALQQMVFAIRTDKKVYKTYEPVQIEWTCQNPDDTRYINGTSVSIDFVDLSTNQSVGSTSLTSFDKVLSGNTEKVVGAAKIPANKFVGGKSYKLVLKTFVTYIGTTSGPTGTGSRLSPELTLTTVITVQ